MHKELIGQRSCDLQKTHTSSCLLGGMELAVCEVTESVLTTLNHWHHQLLSFRGYHAHQALRPCQFRNPSP